ncbi:hypothetical protein A5CPEGH6_10240 [Alistipes dispar]|uniref:GH16 domain-containing protein n=2 Tax=Alistipes dispar TaxID=2585119 RepID=A0A4Y1X1J4_9BACT|nr:hypothetical protein A5CPEGH6_10240 [Alistipes dispar]
MLVSLYGVLSLLIAGYEVSAQPAPGKYLPMTDIRDLVLIYQGGSHRMDYNAEQLRPYVVHEDRFGNRDWLFDGFLFLEFDSGKGVSYHVRGSALLARKEDWAWLVDRHFESGKGIAALDDCIAAAVRELGEPPFRHKVVIGIPEPPRGQKDWGELEGRKLDFSNEEDRIAACKWYADLLEERFRSSGFRHLELAGFYWLPEILRQSREVTRALGDYVRSKGLRFYWIPYYTAQGYSEWRDLGFDAAYLQPTYFWNRKIGDERVDRACELARTYGMGLEMEFDMRASVKSEECRRDRGMGYMSSFRRNGVYRSSAIAYYEGGGGVYYFTKTTAPEDRAFIDTLAYFIRDRRHRMLDGAKPDFRETFGGKRLDTASWNEAPGGKAVVRRGRLLLKGTTRLDTRGRWDLQYGTIAVRARIRSRNPEAKARIRLLPVTERLGAWPDSGDLFLMDYDGSRPGAVACGANTMQMNEVKLQNIKRSVLPVENLYDGFHTFVCKWTERDVVFSVDGTAANIQEDLFDSRFSYYPQGWPFNCDRFYLEISTEAPDGEAVLEVEFAEGLPD